MPWKKCSIFVTVSLLVGEGGTSVRVAGNLAKNKHHECKHRNEPVDLSLLNGRNILSEGMESWNYQ